METKTKSAVPHYVGMAVVQNAIGIALAFFLEKGTLSFPQACDLHGAALAFGIYIILLYVFMFRQALSKVVNADLLEHPVAGKEKFVTDFMENANRTFENALEQAPIFLASFFFYTLLVNPARAAQCGLAYVFLTALYPCLQGSTTVMASTFPRYFMNHFMIWAVIMSAARTTMPTVPTSPPTPAPPVPTAPPHAAPTPPAPRPTPEPQPSGYQMGHGEVYSNNKYLADFDHGQTLETCQDRCDNWADRCPVLCKDKHDCLLSNDVNVRHFTRRVSCTKTCIGFNWHPNTGHCTLFSDNLKLLHGGRGMYYGRPGTKPPGWASMTGGLYLFGHGIAAQNMLTPFALVVGAVAAVQLVLLAVRFARRPGAGEEHAAEPLMPEE